MSLDLYLTIESNDFNIESLVILSLIKFCGINNKQINVYCLYDQLNDNINELKKKYKENYRLIHDFGIDCNSHNDKFEIILKKQCDCPTNILNVSLPIAIIKRKNSIDLINTGLATLCRIIVNHLNLLTNNSFKYLLGYRAACLKACAESSKWTYLCEILPLEIYNNRLDPNAFDKLKIELLNIIEDKLRSPLNIADQKGLNKKCQIRYLQDYNLNLSDFIIYFFITLFKSYFKLDISTYEYIQKWYEIAGENFKNFKKVSNIIDCFLSESKTEEFTINNLFNKFNLNEKIDNGLNDTKESQILGNDATKLVDELISYIKNNFEIQVPLELNMYYTENDMKINWELFEKALNPSSGGLPEKRIDRKCQQLENYIFIIRQLVLSKRIKDKSTIVVDFCSGGGHLGILIAYFFPEFEINLIDNKEESLLFAIKRIEQLKLKNIRVYKGNLNKYIGRFDLGVAIHACGSSTDLILKKCMESDASVIISPCCYGSIKDNNLIKYPRSKTFSCSMDYLNFSYKYLASISDRTERNIKFEEIAYICMNLVDSDRIINLKENNYSLAYLAKLLPEECTLKNNLIVAIK